MPIAVYPPSSSAASPLSYPSYRFEPVKPFEMMVNEKEALGEKEKIPPDLASFGRWLWNYVMRARNGDKRVGQSIEYHRGRGDFYQFVSDIAQAPQNRDKIPENIRRELRDLPSMADEVAKQYPYSKSAKYGPFTSLLRIAYHFAFSAPESRHFNVEENHSVTGCFSQEETVNGLADKTVLSMNGRGQSTNGDGQVVHDPAGAFSAGSSGQMEPKLESPESFEDPRGTFLTMYAAVMYNKVIPFRNSFHPHAEQVLWQQVAESEVVAGRALERMHEMYQKGHRLYLGCESEGVGLRESTLHYLVNTSNKYVNHIIVFKLDDLKQWKIWKLDLTVP